ncbi:VOC family protein [Amycolatopsis sp. GM8]|uniref:VOC family protein n=1 Tax=Amycolatopsis sp. GM8 TaxID=2896530 RepID=UPI001F28B1D3|nr:VOC family protein [Amycolatopsis sp. GM8]
MPVTASHMIHVCVVCSDFDESLDFYTRVLGASVIGEGSSDEGPTFGASMGSPGARKWRGCFLAWGDRNRTSYIDLIQYLGAEAGERVHRNGNDAGLSRIALRVPDLAKTLRELEDLGVPLAGPPTEFVAAGLGRRIAFIRDPDGTLIEFVERFRLG